MQQVAVLYFEFLDVNFPGSKVPMRTARTTPHTPFYKFSSRLEKSMQGINTVILSSTSAQTSIKMCNISGVII